MRPLVVFLVMSTICGGVVTDASAAPLEGVITVGIVIEELREDAALCNVSKDALDAAVRLPLSTSRLKVTNEYRYPYYLYVNVNVMRLPNGVCIANVDISFIRPVELLLADGLVDGSVWSKGSLLSGPSSEFGGRVDGVVEGYTKQFIAAWLKDNDEYLKLVGE
jgi:hypothetical protein